MSDQYRDGCSKKLWLVALMMPWAIAMHVKDTIKVNRKAKRMVRKNRV